MTKANPVLDLAQNKTFCSMAWMHQFLDPTGRVKPCCRFEEKHRPSENHLEQQSLKDIFEGPWMTDVRSKMLRGETVAGCSRCYQEEAAGKKSLRQRYNQNKMLPIENLIDTQSPDIKWIELAISNMCNLACRMCDSRYSKVWFEEELESFGFTQNKEKSTKTDISQIFPFIQSLVHLKFTGGEPLITQEHWQLIDKIVSERDCSDIFLNYSTNCTIFPKPQWIDIWNRFKAVEFALSYDSRNPQEAEYIRWPAKYDKIDLTTKEFFKIAKNNTKVSLILRTTVSILNVWCLPETIIWWQENNPIKGGRINPTHLTHPSFLSITVLPRHLKNKVTQKYQKYISGNYSPELKEALVYTLNYMSSKDDTSLLKELKPYLEKTDAYRKQNFYESYPQFADIFSEDSAIILENSGNVSLKESPLSKSSFEV